MKLYVNLWKIRQEKCNLVNMNSGHPINMIHKRPIYEDQN